MVGSWILKTEADLSLVPGPLASLGPSYHPGLPLLSPDGEARLPVGQSPAGGLCQPPAPCPDRCSGACAEGREALVLADHSQVLSAGALRSQRRPSDS